MGYKVNDFFCGAGGVGIGFMNAGFDVIWACDFDKYAVQTYRQNVGNHVIQADIKELTCKDIPAADVWAFGFPCQDLSVAGKQKGFCFKCSDCKTEFTLCKQEYTDGVKCPKCGNENHKAASRSSMFFEIMRLLDETETETPGNLPKVLMAENVKGLRPYIPVLEREFQKRGYKAYVKLFNSKYWGVPQNRERYYIVGVKQGLSDFEFPEEQRENVPKLLTVLDKDVDEKYYIKDEKAKTIIKQALEKLATLGKVHATLTPERIEKRQNGRRAKSEDEEMFTLTAQDIHGVMIENEVDADTVTAAICRESGLLDKNGVGKMLRTGGTGSLTKKHNFQHILVDIGGIIADPAYKLMTGKYRICNNVAPTLTARDYKEPRLVITETEEINEKPQTQKGN